MLKPINVELNSGRIGVVVDEAVEKIAYFGDATGDSTLSGLDASFISRNVVSLDDGFSAYPLTDPRIIADVTGDGTLSGLDASFVARAVVGNLPATIPAVPFHAAPAMSGLDPTVSHSLGRRGGRRRHGDAAGHGQRGERLASGRFGGRVRSRGT